MLTAYERTIAGRYLLPGRSEGFIFLVAVILRLLAQFQNLAHRLDVEPNRFGFGELIADIVGDCFLFLFKPLDAFNN